jgi:hypothetical protein
MDRALALLAITEIMASGRAPIVADETWRAFISARQSATLTDDEKRALAKRIASMPGTYETDGQGRAAIAHLRYFIPSAGSLGGESRRGVVPLGILPSATKAPTMATGTRKRLASPTFSRMAGRLDISRSRSCWKTARTSIWHLFLCHLSKSSAKGCSIKPLAPFTGAHTETCRTTAHSKMPPLL